MKLRSRIKSQSKSNRLHANSKFSKHRELKGLYQNVIKWMDLETCLNYCKAHDLPLHEAYRHHLFTFEKLNKGMTDICHEIQDYVQNDQKFFEALVQNVEFCKCFSFNEIFLIAAFCGFSDLVSNLIKDYKVDPSFQDNWAIRYSSALGHSEVVNILLLDPRVDPSVSDDLPLIMASCNGHLDVVKRLLSDKRVHPSSQDDSPVIMAAENDHLQVLRALLRNPKVDPSSQDNWALRNAAKNGYNEIVKILLKDQRVDASADENYAIKWANEEGHFDVVNTLAKHIGLDPNNPESCIMLSLNWKFVFDNYCRKIDPDQLKIPAATVTEINKAYILAHGFK